MATNSTFPEFVEAADLGTPFVDFDAVVDPTTELPAEVYNTLVANVVAASYVMPLFWVTVDSTGAYVAGGWSFAGAANVKITSIKNATGSYVVGYDNDDTKHPTDANAYDNAAISVWCVATTLSSSSVFASALQDGAGSVTVYTFDAAGVATDSGFTLFVYKGFL